jgi:hypothetical protein
LSSETFLGIIEEIIQQVQIMFHCKLKEYLDASGRNREWLVNETGLGHPTIYKLYRGPVKQISAKTFLALKKTFNLNSIEDMFTITEEI